MLVGHSSAQIPYSVLRQDWLTSTHPTTYGENKTIGFTGPQNTDLGALTYYERFDSSIPSIKGCFAFNYQGVTTKTFDLPDGIYITDFVQLEGTDLIVFCGIINQSVISPIFYGVVGYFHINIGLSNITVNYEYFTAIDKFVAVSTYVNSNTGSTDIVAIGKVNGSNDRIVYFNDLLNNSYQTYLVDKNQKLWNIVKTENYLVFAGYDWNFPGLCLRKELYTQKGSPLLLNTVYGYILPDGEPSAMIHSAYLGNDMNRQGDLIAVSTPTFVNNKTESRYRFF